MSAEQNGAAVRVWVIEDNPDDVLFIRTAFQRRLPSAEFTAFSDGDEALAALRRETPRHYPTLILLDLNLPARDGHDVLRELKSTPQWQHVPVIVLTASRAERDFQRSLAHHANAHVVKPDDFRQYEALTQDIAGFWLRWASRSGAAQPTSALT